MATLKIAILLILNTLQGAPNIAACPRRIAKHPELSELLPLPACKGMSSELGLVCLDNLHGRDAYEEKRKGREKEEKRKIG